MNQPDDVRIVYGPDDRRFHENAGRALTGKGVVCGECARLRAELATARREREAVQHLLGYLRDVAQGRVRYLDRGVVLSQLQEIDRAVAPSPGSTPQKGEGA